MLGYNQLQLSLINIDEKLNTSWNAGREFRGRTISTSRRGKWAAVLKTCTKRCILWLAYNRSSSTKEIAMQLGLSTLIKTFQKAIRVTLWLTQIKTAWHTLRSCVQWKSMSTSFYYDSSCCFFNVIFTVSVKNFELECLHAYCVLIREKVFHSFCACVFWRFEWHLYKYSFYSTIDVVHN